jgi:hypothetical protein
MTSTSHFLIGACVGEAVVPLFMGLVIGWAGVGAFQWAVLATTAGMGGIFALIRASANGEGSQEGVEKGGEAGLGCVTIGGLDNAEYGSGDEEVKA